MDITASKDMILASQAVLKGHLRLAPPCPITSALREPHSVQGSPAPVLNNFIYLPTQPP